MLANSLLKSALNVSYTASIYSHQQVRFARKTFRLKAGGHGGEPLITTDDFEEAKEAGLLEDLSYKEIRFPLPYENNSPLFDRQYEKFCKFIMKGGRKGLAHELMHDTMFEIKRIQYKKMKTLEEKKAAASDTSAPHQEEGEEHNVELNPLTILKTALKNSEPLLMTKKVKRGGATYQVPYPVSKDQSEYHALKWMIKAVLERPKPRTKHFNEVMAQELLDAFYFKGKVIKRRDDVHRLADANKAYAHYRWG